MGKGTKPPDRSRDDGAELGDRETEQDAATAEEVQRSAGESLVNNSRDHAMNETAAHSGPAGVSVPAGPGCLRANYCAPPPPPEPEPAVGPTQFPLLVSISSPCSPLGLSKPRGQLYWQLIPEGYCQPV